MGSYSGEGAYLRFGLSGWALIQRWVVNRINLMIYNNSFSYQIDIFSLFDFIDGHLRI